MAATFKSNDTSIADILRQIDSGSVQLPDFQRGWVWDDHRIKALCNLDGEGVVKGFGAALSER